VRAKEDARMGKAKRKKTTPSVWTRTQTAADASALRAGRFYNVEELAGLFDVTPWAVYGWVRQRRLPVLRVGKSLLFPVDAVDKLIARRTVAAR
jgi:excisionase family DNA binding protein